MNAHIFLPKVRNLSKIFLRSFENVAHRYIMCEFNCVEY